MAFRTFWMVLGCGTPTFKHATEQAACAEAKRLASANPGQMFYVLEAVSRFSKPDVIQEDADREHAEGIPF